MITILERGGPSKWLQYYIFKEGGSLQMITIDYMGGVRKNPKINYVILEQPLKVTQGKVIQGLITYGYFS